jgi:hypothetical protein
MKIKVKGHSDDTFGVYGLPAKSYSFMGAGKAEAMDDVDCCANWDYPLVALLFSKNEKRGYVIVAHYHGTWGFAVLMHEKNPTDDYQLFWPVSRSAEGYSEILEIEVPDDCEVVWAKLKNGLPKPW